MGYELKLKAFRKNRKITQGELAKIVGVSERKLAGWERGDTNILFEDACKCSIALGCTPNDLCGWYDNHPREEGGEILSSDESEILDCYRESTPQWKQNISMTARAAAGESKEEKKLNLSTDEEGMTGVA